MARSHSSPPLRRSDPVDAEIQIEALRAQIDGAEASAGDAQTHALTAVYLARSSRRLAWLGVALALLALVGLLAHAATHA